LRRWSLRHWAGSAAALLVVFLAGAAFAAPRPAAPSAAAARSDLDDLHRRIRALQAEIESGESSRDEAVDDLAEVETAISAARRRVREITHERQGVEAELHELEARRAALETTLAAQRKALGDMLYRYYVFGRKAGARRLIGGDDPNQLARDAYYLARIAEARHAEIEKARATLAEHERLVGETRIRSEKVAALQQESAAAYAKLLSEQKKRSAVLARIKDKLRSQRKQVANLKQNETRLARLVQGLGKLSRPKSTPPRPDALAQKPPESGANAEREPAVGVANKVAQENSVDSVFSALRGKLHWPLRGELVGRFGAPRGDSGTQWKGVLIRAESGEVHAVAPGQVVFADWLRGFGNLIILDHGDGFMTIYGNNESVFKSPGETVRGGEAIASVGNSGGSEESGLYFEIRYHGQPQDPAKWMAR
jgi:septal ring factor EnvC (AmiA/AmiB activator)